MENKKLEPALRFPGFTDAWEQRKLGEVILKNNKRNKDLLIDNVESVSNKTGFTRQTEQFEDYSVASADLSNYYIISEKQFAYNPSRINVGSIAYKEKGEADSVVSPLYVSFYTRDILNDRFLWYWMKTNSFDRQRGYFSEGGVRDTLSFGQLSEMIIICPEETEQQLVGDSFSQLDNLITLHQRKLSDLQNLKAGLLQKMFPQNGSNVPEVRFPGFTDAWEQRKLGDVSLFKSSSLTIANRTCAGVYSLYDAIGPIGFVDVQGQNEKYISIIKDGAGVGRIRKMPESSAVLGTMGIIKPKDSCLDFLFSLLERCNLTKYITGSTIPHIYYSSYSAEQVHTPSLREQKVIGDFFNELDDLITLHQRKLENLQNMKKSLLQQMFI